MPEIPFPAGERGIARALGNARPELVRPDPLERQIRPPNRRDGLEAHHFEGVGVPKKPAHDAGDLEEVSPRHRDGRRGLEAPARTSASAPDQVGELRTEPVELGLRGRPGVAVAPPAHRRVDVERYLGEAATNHEPLQQAALSPERLAVGHEHRDEPDRTRVRDELHELRLGPQGHLAVGELDVPGRPEPLPDRPHLRFHVLDRARATSIPGRITQQAPR